ncbi:hypothetical protein AKJ54_00090, partial [candidate division MSBL1 archaeon SCGC-AAA382K21]
KAIVDGELVAIKKNTESPMPFQEVLRRRRKYDIRDVAEDIPVHIYLFDVLLSGGNTVLDKPYVDRRAELENIVDSGEKVKLVENRILDNTEDIETFRSQSISMGHEGLLAKDLDSTYRAGKREFAWMKLKAGVETLDFVVVGAFAGKGDRTGTFGSYLVAGRDEETGRLKTVSKVGSGFTDEDLENLTKFFEELRISDKPSDLDSEIEPDYWFKPKEVFEINYEEIQKSPKNVHTSGYGLRFPRYVKTRDDLDASSVDAIEDMESLFKKQDNRRNGEE